MDNSTDVLAVSRKKPDNDQLSGFYVKLIVRVMTGLKSVDALFSPPL